MEILRKVLKEVGLSCEIKYFIPSNISGKIKGKTINPIPTKIQFKEKRKKYKTLGIKKPIIVSKTQIAIKEKSIQNSISNKSYMILFYQKKISNQENIYKK